jgi:hypothetical protein
MLKAGRGYLRSQEALRGAHLYGWPLLAMVVGRWPVDICMRGSGSRGEMVVLLVSSPRRLCGFDAASMAGPSGWHWVLLGLAQVCLGGVVAALL